MGSIINGLLYYLEIQGLYYISKTYYHLNKKYFFLNQKNYQGKH